jgi:hypothetical protein
VAESKRRDRLRERGEEREREMREGAVAGRPGQGAQV